MSFAVVEEAWLFCNLMMPLDIKYNFSNIIQTMSRLSYYSGRVQLRWLMEVEWEKHVELKRDLTRHNYHPSSAACRRRSERTYVWTLERVDGWMFVPHPRRSRLHQRSPRRSNWGGCLLWVEVRLELCVCVCVSPGGGDGRESCDEWRSGWEGSGETVIFFHMWGGLLWLVWRVVDHRVWFKRCRGGRCR